MCVPSARECARSDTVPEDQRTDPTGFDWSSIVRVSSRTIKRRSQLSSGHEVFHGITANYLWILESAWLTARSAQQNSEMCD
jgi:hypothetical protein